MFEYSELPGLIKGVGIVSGGKKVDCGCDTVVTMFRNDALISAIDRYKAKRIGEIAGSIELPVYKFEYEGKSGLICLTPVGAPNAASVIEELAASGLKNFVVYGICGALKDLPKNTFIAPEFALRDEGTSYAYTPSKDERITVRNADVVHDSLIKCGLNAVKGGVWTTDAFYRETREKANYAVGKGAICVDMECSAIAAVCEFLKVNQYQFFFTADSLSGEEWVPNDILDSKASINDVATAAAIKLFHRVSK